MSCVVEINFASGLLKGYALRTLSIFLDRARNIFSEF
jgi:hypothetical protein